MASISVFKASVPGHTKHIYDFRCILIVTCACFITLPAYACNIKECLEFAMYATCDVCVYVLRISLVGFVVCVISTPKM